MEEANPVIIPRSGHSVSRKDISPNVRFVLHQLNREGHTAYLVGGCVRDLLLGLHPKDFDVVTSATPSQLKKVFRNCRLIGRRFRLAHVHFRDEIVEVATFRSSLDDQQGTEEEHPVAPGTPGRELPGIVKSADGLILRDNLFGTPAQDAWRRDFTVNALFYSIQDFTLIDYVGGLDDLRRRLIRAIGDPHRRFVEDPVRMVRAMRFAAKLGFNLEPETHQALLAHCEDISKASSERMFEETLKLFLLGAAESTLRMLLETGLFGLIFPSVAEFFATGPQSSRAARLLRAGRWMDSRVQAGEPVSASLMYALLFGPFIETRANVLMDHGTPLSVAFKEAEENFTRELSSCVMLSRGISLRLREILGNQWRFLRTRGRPVRTFPQMPFFPEALDYLRGGAEAGVADPELVAFWENAARGQGHSAPEPGRPDTSRHASRRRRRRRGGRRPGGVKDDPGQKLPDNPGPEGP